MILASIASAVGTVWWSILMFILGGLIGVPLWNWIKSKIAYWESLSLYMRVVGNHDSYFYTYYTE